MLVEALNFIAVPGAIAAVQIVLYLMVLPKFGIRAFWAWSPLVPILAMVGIFFGGGWISFYSLLGPIPGAVPMYQFVMAMISFVPLMLMAFARRA
ncbi:hypothetical protein KDD17_08295 [Sulfitobacter albidus]|uniref:Uncharacterized protein n=1 Tax=Sulfitobacter albidus TaxID=2829501 RepID=A0A975PKS9_9RHOB|nr:hypothetical protein [Sulfitobacter albidus]QUJ75047.1 hypothetical protein KDD17_08295 [Sulfitobacter albidus]